MLAWLTTKLKRAESSRVKRVIEPRVFRPALVADLDFASREGPRRGGEILGCVLGSAGHPRGL
jgi:hypothetical protein